MAYVIHRHDPTISSRETSTRNAGSGGRDGGVTSSPPHGWTPIGYHAWPEPTLLWVDLRGYPIDKRRFDQSLETWLETERPPVIRTGLAALTAPDRPATVAPRLIIAHASRCGSTLLARLAAAAGDDAELLLEPNLIRHLLTVASRGRLGQPLHLLLRAAVAALTPEGSRPCVLKLGSQMTRFLPEIRAAFPETPVVWLQRRPADIVESNLSMPPGPPRPGSTDETIAWVVRRVALAFMAAQAFVDERVTVLDYRDMPETAWTRLTAIMGLDPAARHDRMRDVMRYDSKSGAPFVPRARQPLPEAIQAMVRDTLDPLYNALALRGAA